MIKRNETLSDYSDEEKEEHSINEEVHQNEFIYKVKKLGQRGYSHKARILYICQEGIFYYPMISKSHVANHPQELKDLVEKFLKEINDSTSGMIDKKSKEVIQYFKELRDNNLLVEKNHFSNFRVEQPPSPISSFTHPVKIINQDVPDEEIDFPLNHWIMEMFTQSNYSSVMGAKKAIKESNASEEVKQNDKEKMIKDNEQKDVSNTSKKKNDITEITEQDKKHYLEFIYQKLITIYWNHLKTRKKGSDSDEQKKVYWELALYYCYRQFVENCEWTAMKIISDWGGFDKNTELSISFQSNLHPIVFPNPFFFSQEHNAVLWYFYLGVTYTWTWNKWEFKIKNTKAFTNGKWKGLKHQFNQKDYFQDFICKLAQYAEKPVDFPNIPMCCVVDYAGFRVYCESDIFCADENQENKEDELLHDLSKIISSGIENPNVIFDCSPDKILSEKKKSYSDYIRTMMDSFRNSFTVYLDNKKVSDNDNKIVEKRTQQEVTKFKFLDYVKKKQIKTMENNNNKTFSYSIHGRQNPNMGSNQNSVDLFYTYQDEVLKESTKKDWKYIMDFNVWVSHKTHDTFYRQEIVHKIINEKVITDRENDIKNKILQNAKDDKESSMNKKDVSSTKSPGKPTNMNQNANNEKDRLLIDMLKIVTAQTNVNVHHELDPLFQRNWDSLIFDLDSLFLVPYNSETWKICFHHFGINLHYLGYVAEMTKVPHVREWCLIEMFARVCKKLIFDWLGQSTFDKAIGSFYDKMKEITTTLPGIPVSFNWQYGSEYWKSIIQPFEGFSNYERNDVLGWYLPREDENPLKNEADTSNTKKVKDKENSKIKFQPISAFFSVLFEASLDDNHLTWYGEDYSTTQALWNFIIKIMKEKYQITNDDVFMYCKLETIPIFPWVSAIQYHTGIKFSQNGFSSLLEKGTNQKFDIIAFESVSFKPKTTYFSYTWFSSKAGKSLPLRNNFALHYPGHDIYYNTKILFYTDKYWFRKAISHNYYYWFYLKIMKNWHNDKKRKTIKGKEFDFDSIVVADNPNFQINPNFEENFNSFLVLLLTQYQAKIPKGKLADQIDTQTKTDNSNSWYTCERILSMYWNPKHLFLSILKSTYAKALYKNTINRKEEGKIISLFSSSVDIAKDALGELNIYYGKLTRDVGLFFEKNFKLYEAYQMFLVSFKVYKKHKIMFKWDYFYSLKYWTKTCVYWGRLGEGLNYGYNLIKEITYENQHYRANPDRGQQPVNYWTALNNMSSFAFNMLKISKHLAEYETGVEIGNIFFKSICINSFRWTKYKNWIKTSAERVQKLVSWRSEQNNRGDFKFATTIRLQEFDKCKPKSLYHVIKAYLKCLFKGLIGSLNQTYARAFVRFIEDNPQCDDEVKNDKNQPKYVSDEIWNIIFRKSNEFFDEYFKFKILYYIKQKYDKEHFDDDEVEKSYLKASSELILIFRNFPKIKKLFKN